jgi:hypothetical protein
MSDVGVINVTIWDNEEINIAITQLAGANSWGSIIGDISDQTDLQAELDNKITGVGVATLTVSLTEPANPQVNDIWVDLNL